jgi:hypothetical protein
MVRGPAVWISPRTRVPIRATPWTAPPLSVRAMRDRRSAMIPLPPEELGVAVQSCAESADAGARRRIVIPQPPRPIVVCEKRQDWFGRCLSGADFESGDRGLAIAARCDRWHPAPPPCLQQDQEVAACDRVAAQLDDRPRIGRKMLHHYRLALCVANDIHCGSTIGPEIVRGR